MTKETSRLHITPFYEDLAEAVVSRYPSLATQDISYHRIETFPENSFGFVELPSMEAEKLKKKLNGSILKGKKLQVADARPQKRGFEPDDEVDATTSAVKQRKLRTRTSNATDAELHGHQLSPGRKVKRGWTEASKGQQDCLFRVQVPANREVDPVASTTAAKEPGSEKNKKKIKSENSRTTIVHEFDKSITQPAFIRQETSAGTNGVTAEFVEEKGWINHDGQLVEPVSKRQLRYHKRMKESNLERKTPVSNAAGSLHTAKSRDREPSSAESDNDDHAKDKVSSPSWRKDPAGKSGPVRDTKEATSSSGTSSSSTGFSPVSKSNSGTTSPVEAGKSSVDQDVSKSGTIDEAQLHPLEALFKRPKQVASRLNGKQPLNIQTTFNFFGPDGEPAMPQTPFTAKDLQLRGQRSAAPTPDTALPTRQFFPGSASPSSNADVADKIEGEKAPGVRLSSQEVTEVDGETDFAKWFWENRGDNNRAWKKRRREAMKDDRQRENRERERRQKHRRGE